MWIQEGKGMLIRIHSPYFILYLFTVFRIRIQGLPGSGSGLRFFAGSGFDEYGSETLPIYVWIRIRMVYTYPDPQSF